MLDKTLILSIICGSIFVNVICQNESFKCFDVDCPSGSNACKREIKTSDDKTQLVTIVLCIRADGSIADNLTKAVDNPHGPYTDFRSTSFSGRFTNFNGNFSDPNIMIRSSFNTNLFKEA